ncbi:uncharacterized protein LOC141627822 [Silene latifolia]|uniref:uncharacterized protein LOC141627822 n=1 Tax=Silene latifolia TaxID=37657 RepID=UPI003D777A57
MVCLITSTYTLNLNGAHFGYFPGKRADKWYFRYHPLSKSLKLNHLLFADDLLMFCKGDNQSIMLLLRVMATFSAASGFQEGNLPFKYLGVPIQPCRLLRKDCRVLTDKIASIFLIPKCVIHQIEAICRNFLWESGTDYNMPPLVAWSNICYTNKEGGLRIKNAGLWNVASVGKLVHWLYTKADRLWVLWIDHVYLKGADWSSYQPSPDAN